MPPKTQSIQAATVVKAKPKKLTPADILKRDWPTFLAWLEDPKGGEVESNVLWLPFPPNRANLSDSTHWRNVRRAHGIYDSHCDYLLAHKLIPPPPPKPAQRSFISTVLYVARYQDHDNAVGRFKYPLDWMVKKGYIRDDSYEALDWADMPKQIKDKRFVPCVSIMFRPSSAAAVLSATAGEEERR